MDTLEHVVQALYVDLVPEQLRVTSADRAPMGQARFWSRLVEGWSQVDPGGVLAQRTIEELVRSGATLDPTLAVFPNLLLDPSEVPDRSGAEALVPTNTKATWDRIISFFTAGWTPTDYTNAARALDAWKGVVRRFRAAGGRVVAGTDLPFPYLPAGYGVHSEMQMLHDAGLSSIETIASATGSAAEVLGLSDEIGSIAPGLQADLVMLAADPIRSISASRAITRVYRGGVVVHGDGQTPV